MGKLPIVTRRFRNSTLRNGDCIEKSKYIYITVKGKSVPLQAWRCPEGSRKLRFPDFVTKAQDGDRLPALRNGRLYPQEMFLVLISVRG